MASNISYWEASMISLAESLKKNWWLFLLRGLAAIAFGVMSLVWPSAAMLSLVLLFGAFAVVDGLCALIAGIRGRTTGVAPSWWLVTVGLLGIGAGLFALFWPAVSALALLYLIAGWTLVTGVLQIIGGIQLRKEIENEWLLILNGALSIVFGVIVFAMPQAGALALMWLIGAFATLYGALLAAFAFRLRQYTASVS